MGRVLTFGRKPSPPAPKQAPAPIQRPAAEVYLCGSDADGWLVIDMSPSGGSADTHGTYPTRAEAMAEGRRVAYRLGATFLDDEDSVPFGGGAA
jgi:hypothetical protein